MDFKKLLKIMAFRKASDLFITVGFPVSIKLDGKMLPLTKSPLDPTKAHDLVFSVMNDEQRQEYLKKNECNFAISESGIGRFRISAFKQRSHCGMVMRRIEQNIPDLDELNLPQVLQNLSMMKRGLVIVVGATGTGKSTTLAAMIGHRNENDSGHIITIEDPIEFLHKHRQCMVTQREIGIDTDSYEVALKNTLRQAPDVIMIGEIRSKETMEYALAFAETGHLCVATLHANNANQALDRILHFFPADRHSQVWADLSLNLKGVVAQQLVPAIDGNGRKAVVEVLLNTPLAQDMIRYGDAAGLKTLMKKSTELGMKTFDQALYELYKNGDISFDVAMAHADSSNDLRLMIKLDSDTASDILQEHRNELTLEYDEP
ncbi:type IV pili twitching motility protein PilT [Endozoicomonas sp. (ex Bugula neritina AB1)]|nr:type IV pili twitching motility protein PilT [Endozoicomonas sp. (ex Bugula neritina AB1)]